MRGDFACRRSDRKIATRAANTRMVGSFSNRDAIGCKAANYHNPPLLANESLRLPDVRTTLWEGAGTTARATSSADGCLQQRSGILFGTTRSPAQSRIVTIRSYRP